MRAVIDARKTLVYAEFGGQTECIMGNWKVENTMEASVVENKKEEMVQMPC